MTNSPEHFSAKTIYQQIVDGMIGRLQENTIFDEKLIKSIKDLADRNGLANDKEIRKLLVTRDELVKE